jgi:hypothetical protein
MTDVRDRLLGGAGPVETHVESPRRFGIRDALVFIAVTAAAVPATNVLLPEAVPVFQQAYQLRLFNHAHPRYLFATQMRSSRRESIGFQFSRLVAPILAHVEPPGRFIDPKTRQRVSFERAQENWLLTHAPPGALGFALAQDGYFLVFHFLLLWSLGLAILRMFPPRPALAVVFRQPGWWACSGAMTGTALAYAAELIIEFPAPSVIVPATVMVAWLGLVASRQWKSESSWIDRAGRLIGIFWLMTIPIYITGFVWAHWK